MGTQWRLQPAGVPLLVRLAPTCAEYTGTHSCAIVVHPQRPTLPNMSGMSRSRSQPGSRSRTERGSSDSRPWRQGEALLFWTASWSRGWEAERSWSTVTIAVQG